MKKQSQTTNKQILKYRQFKNNNPIRNRMNTGHHSQAITIGRRQDNKGCKHYA